MALCRGKLPAQPGAISFRFGDFINASKLPELPLVFGHSLSIPPTGWGMLGNDRYGDCVMAGAAHETMLWAKEAGGTVTFNPQGVINQYLSLAGGDVGLEVQKAAEWRRTIGITDANGNIHKIAAYLALDPGNMEHLYYGLYLFGAVGIGWRLPDVADQQFDDGVPWDFTDAVPGDGHYTPLVGRRPGMLHIITWGKRYPVRESSMNPTFVDEAVVYVSEEALVDRKSPEGFDYAQLTDYLNMLA